MARTNEFEIYALIATGNTAANYESSASSFIDYTNATFGFYYNIRTFDHLV